MAREWEQALRRRAKSFARFAAALREELEAQEFEPSDDALLKAAVDLYAIEPDEDEMLLAEDEEEAVAEEDWE